MKFLLVIAHGVEDAKSHSHDLANSAKDVLKAQGNEVEIFDLITNEFNSQLSKADIPGHENDHPLDVIGVQLKGVFSDVINNVHKKFEWARHVIVFGPLWFYILPAIIYSFIERVSTPVWGYIFSKKREEFVLYGKKLGIVTTSESPLEVGNRNTGIEGLLFNLTYSFWQAGFRVIRSLPFLPNHTLIIGMIF
jgi:putative NADPH-quinone reductase